MNETLPLPADMPAYQSHKVVRALKLGGMEITLRDVVAVSEDGFVAYLPRDSRDPSLLGERIAAAAKDPDDAGYLVLYEDGYWSWSPTKAFESGYTRL